jgi:phosphoesterase RecJ-like protein
MHLKELAQKLIEAKEPVIISTHCCMDGDAIGSEIALAHALRSKGKDVSILNQDALPEQFNFLQQYFDLFAIENVNKKENITVVIVDANDLNKLGETIKYLITEELSVQEIIFIDHHNPKNKISNAKYFISDHASSTGEIIYKLISEEFGLKIDNVLAEAIYTAIVCDTRSFRYSRTNAYSHQIASDLIKLGIEPEKIQTELFGCNTLGQINLLGYVLNNAKLSNNKKIAYAYIPVEKLTEHKVLPSDTKGFINNLLTIKDVEVAVLFRQDKKDEIKVSIRSKGTYNIHELAEKFGGGGHKFAATFTSNKSFDELKKEVISTLEHI